MIAILDEISTIINDLLQELGLLYENKFEATLGNFISILTFLIAVIIGFWILTSIFPFIGRITNSLFIPFKILHYWFHLQAVKNLNRKQIKKTGKSKANVGVIFYTGNWKRDEFSGLSIRPGIPPWQDQMNIRDAFMIATASSTPSILLLLLLIFLAPFVIANPLLIIFHLYCLLGVVFGLMPSSNDQMFVLHTIMATTNISVWYLIYPFLLFGITSSIYTLKYDLLQFHPPFWWIEPILMGFYTMGIYFIMFIAMVSFSYAKTPIEEFEEDLETERRPNPIDDFLLF